MREFIKLTFGLLLLLGLLVSAQEDSAAISSAGGASSVEPTPSDVPVDVTSPVVTPTPSEEPVVPVPGTESPSDQGPVDVPSSVASEVSISAQSSPLVSSSDLVEASATSADESSTTDASASATPTEGEDDGEAEEYDFEAREVTPLESRPDVVTEDELLAEAEANLPVMEIPEEDAREIAALEASMFEHFVRNDPVINPEDNITLPESVSNCELGLGKRDMAGGWSGQSNSRVMRRQECRPVTRLDCDLHIWHMLSARGAKRPDTIETRIEESVAYLKSVFEPRGIYFNHVSTNFRQPVSTTADWKTLKKKESKLVKWQTASRAGDHMALNLWLVNNLVPADGVEKSGGNLMGYSTFPEMQRWATDGIVMQHSAMGTPATTFVHEVGHWLGLRHTFGNRVDEGETDCLVGDGLRRTTHTRGDRSVIFECQQLPCNEERGVMRIPNFMSVSRRPGSLS
ncbi:Extracellular metalloprotease like protein [Verticillium longisporum]|uniref:Extracellular metalloprotease like protein n=1 Tax=Verticillium longisporum TaxID=100787 RepID=A0A8I2ZXG4_VERLO|nr:Extracellular metalloprotease like protein [Verticillium longisporum]